MPPEQESEMAPEQETQQELQPVAQGSFSKTPFSHILIYLLEKKMSGTLVVTDKKYKVSVYFRDGTPAKVQTSIPGRELGRVLLKMNFIDEEQLKICDAEISESGGFQGQILIDQGAIGVNTLIRGLREQNLLKLGDVFAMTTAGYAFYEKVNLLMGFGPDEVFPIDSYPLIMAGMRTYWDKYDLEAGLRKLYKKWLSLDSLSETRRFRLNQAEKNLCGALLTIPHLYEQLLKGGEHDRDMVRYVLYVLLITKQLIISDQPPIESEIDREDQTGKLESAPPAKARDSEDPEIAAKKKEIRDKARAIASQNYYEMLEIPLNASSEDARKAFFKAARKFHPDRVPSSISAELKDALQYVFSNLSEAHSTLIDPDAREEYNKAIGEEEVRTSQAPPPADEAEVRDILEAEKLYQKALVYVQRSQTDKALEAIERARTLNPKEGDYLAVWAHLQEKLRPRGASCADLIEKLRQALVWNPRSERIMLYMAQMFKREGKMDSARAYYEKVLELNPKNIEAGREINLMKMRKKKEQEKSKGKGLLKRFFK